MHKICQRRPLCSTPWSSRGNSAIEAVAARGQPTKAPNTPLVRCGGPRRAPLQKTSCGRGLGLTTQNGGASLARPRRKGTAERSRAPREWRVPSVWVAPALASLWGAPAGCFCEWSSTLFPPVYGFPLGRPNQPRWVPEREVGWGARQGRNLRRTAVLRAFRYVGFGRFAAYPEVRGIFFLVPGGVCRRSPIDRPVSRLGQIAKGNLYRDASTSSATDRCPPHLRRGRGQAVACARTYFARARGGRHLRHPPTSRVFFPRCRRLREYKQIQWSSKVGKRASNQMCRSTI